MSERDTVGDWLRHLFVAAAWVLAFRLLADHLVRLLPLALARSLTLQNYLVGVQLMTLGLGLAISFLMLRAPRDALGLRAGSLARIGMLVVLSPAIYVIASYLAIYVALPTLLAELAARGRQAVQQSTGEFGREIAQASLLSTLIFSVFVSPLGEELMFRGAVWSLIQRGIEALGSPRDDAAPTSAELLPEGVLSESFGLRLARGARALALGGGIATLSSAGVFAWMHADTPGGLGIVRWMSALGLGLAAGSARHATRSVLGALAVHMSFNLWSLATTRRWLVSERFGMKLGVPVLLSALAVASALVVLVFGIVVAKRARASS